MINYKVGDHAYYHGCEVVVTEVSPPGAWEWVRFDFIGSGQCHPDWLAPKEETPKKEVQK